MCETGQMGEMTSTKEISKREIRKAILAERRALDPETSALASQVICRKLMYIDVYEEAEDICLYMPYNNEVDVMLLAEVAKEQGKRVWVPKVLKKSLRADADNTTVQAGEMVFNRYMGSDAGKITAGAYGIIESTSDEILEPDDKTLIILPGAVYTPWRERIGYGGGFYDRYLAEHPMCKTIGVCYDLQVVDELPAEEHDIKPDYVVCESGIYG